MKSTEEIKYGAILSYVLLIANAIYGLFITPFILRYISVDTYGVYTSVSSLTGTLAVVDLGLGTTMTRYIARFNATGEKEKENNFIAMTMIQFFVILICLLCIGVFYYFSLGNVYHATFSDEQIEFAQLLFVILLINMAMRLLENLFFGIANGSEKFVFSNTIRIIGLVIKIAIVVVGLPLLENVLVICLAETAVAILTIIFFVYYCFAKLQIRPKLISWDRELFKESFGYTVLMFIQTLVIQFNGNVDNILIGAQISAGAVTVYSMALTIYNMYQNISGSIANLMLPRITKKVVNGCQSAELQRDVELFGRYQFFLLAAALGGFISLGKDFFYLWLGIGYEDCYLLSIILIASVTLPTLGNVALSILRAQNKMIFRTATVVISCCVNAIVTYFGILTWGYWGAAIGTALSSIINFVLMNLYYHYKLDFQIIKMLVAITGKTVICGFFPTIMVLLIKPSINSWFVFLMMCILFMAIYSVLIFCFAFDKQERKQIIRRIQRKNSNE